MSPLSKSLDECKFRLPKPILDAVFIQRDVRYRQLPASIDEHILNEVIRPRVLVDCNLAGGAEVVISLDGVPVTMTEDYGVASPFTTVYRIPKSRTQGRSIMSVLNIMFSNSPMTTNGNAMANNQNSSMLQAGSAVFDAMASIPVTSTAKIQLIGENVVMVRDSIVMPNNCYLRCVVANDENMSHLPLKAYRQFSELVVLAVKAYVYNSYVIAMGLGELFGGQNLGVFKDIIDGYADSDELYRTYLEEKMTKVLFMSDREAYTRLLKTIISGNR